MSGFINTNHKQIVQSMNDMQKDLVKNRFYLFTDKKASIVDYYNIDTTRSTLDQALHIPYANLGEDSPIRFNYIHNFFLYGLDRIAFNLENGEFGIESSEISGDAIIIPGTITPYPGDYFCVNMIDKRYLFKVIEVSPDTFNNGANYWRITYNLNKLEDTKIKPLVVDEYEYYEGNTGTKLNPIILKTKWDLAKELDDRNALLKKVYKSLYYNEQVQTFTFVHMYEVCVNNLHSDYFYDPYMIEFLIKNGVMKNDGDQYVYIGHKTYLPPEFPIRYSKSIWSILESRELDNIDSCIISSYGEYISDQSTIFQTRYENYFELIYASHPSFEWVASSIQILDQQVIGHIKEKQLFAYDSSYAKYNIIIKYMNQMDLTIDDIKVLERFGELDRNEQNYFVIPMIIFCADYYIKKLLS